MVITCYTRRMLLRRNTLVLFVIKFYLFYKSMLNYSKINLLLGSVRNVSLNYAFHTALKYIILYKIISKHF